MSHIINYLKEHYQLNDNDIYIWQYMLDNIDSIPYMSSRKLAEATFTHPTTILRLSKKCGFQNFNDLKIHIQSFVKQMSTEYQNVIDQNDILSTINNLTELQTSVIQQTKEALNYSDFYNIIQIIQNAHYIDIVADDANSDIAEYASHNFCIVNKTVTVYKTADKQLYLGLNVQKNHVIIFMSKHVINKQILQTAKLIKKRKIPSIALTTDGQNNLAKNCNYSLICAFDPSISKLGDLVFNISSKYLFDLMFAILFAKNYDETLELGSIHKKIYLNGL